jgi:hypothetical protein
MQAVAAAAAAVAVAVAAAVSTPVRAEVPAQESPIRTPPPAPRRQSCVSRTADLPERASAVVADSLSLPGDDDGDDSVPFSVDVSPIGAVTSQFMGAAAALGFGGDVDIMVLMRASRQLSF